MLKMESGDAMQETYYSIQNNNIMKPTNILFYFLACLFFLSLDINFLSLTTDIIYRVIILANMANAIRLITIYDNNRYESK